MKEEIIDYLTLKHLSAEGFNPQDNQRIKKAFILAQIDYANLDTKEKQEILRIIKGENHE